MMDLKGVFNSDPKSILDTVSDAGLCFYLPAYQRPYSWNKQNVIRVFEDVLNGMANSVRNEDAITFIGTLLTIHDTKYQTVTPLKRGEVPAKVMLVIDGQQRLTTLLAIMSVLHEQLKLKEAKLLKDLNKSIRESEESPDNEELAQSVNDYEWILDKLNQEIANLHNFSTNTNSNRDKYYKWYPKLIRAYIDCWSKVEAGASYESPIAKYLHEYNLHVLKCEEDNKYKKFSYQISEDIRDQDKHQTLINNLKVITKSIRAIAVNADEESNQPSLKELMDGEFKESFQFDIPSMFLHVDANKTAVEALNLIVFAKYLLNRVCVTYVTVTDEAYAFDMFEALNTTGEPLTSIETFKPKVIEEEGIGEYEASISKKYMDVVDEYLDRINDANKKHKETTRIMISFALSETGEKISKHISDQRRYLVDEYRPLTTEQKRDFVKGLAHTTKFYYEEWDNNIPEVTSDHTSENNVLLMCFDVLRKANHEITVPIIVQYYTAVLEAPINSSERRDALRALEQVLKSIVAFFVFWRSAHKNTAGIDGVYRELMKSGLKDVGLAPLSRKEGDIQSPAVLSAALRYKLEEKIVGQSGASLKERWLQMSQNNPVYDISLPLTRFMLLAALHDTCPSDEDGLVDGGTPGSLPLLNLHKWNRFFDDEAEVKWTVEHVAPQTLTNDWDRLLDDRNLLGSIGNLTILPSTANSSVGNQSWEKKKGYYSTLCQESIKERQDALSNMNTNQQLVFEKAEYLRFFEPLAEVGNWDAAFVKSRSQNLLERIWATLYAWLK